MSVTNVPIQTFAGADKLTHAGMYCVAAFAWRSSIRSPSEPVSWWVVFAIGALGAIDEWHQMIVPGRSADVRDWLADVTGALIGVGVWRWLRARKRAAL